MTDRPLQSAPREWRDQFCQPTVLVVLSAVVAILTIVAPYGTGDALRAVPRLGYWAAIVTTTYGAGSFVVAVLRAILPPWGFAPRMVLAGLAAGGVVASLVLAINAAMLGFVPDAAALPGFVLSIAAMTMVNTLSIAWISVQNAARGQDAPVPPPILERLPLDKRGALMALSLKDHYIRVQTTAGTTMALMRLSDAMRETGDVAGAQVHRSHWVAFSAVRAARRDGDRAVLTLASGAEIPVSRANLPKVKEAGLLPR